MIKETLVNILKLTVVAELLHCTYSMYVLKWSAAQKAVAISALVYHFMWLKSVEQLFDNLLTKVLSLQSPSFNWHCFEGFVPSNLGAIVYNITVVAHSLE